MLEQFMRSLARPEGVKPDAPKGFALMLTIGFVVALLLPCVATVGAIIWSLQVLPYFPEAPVRIAAIIATIVMLIASVPITARFFWQMMKAE